MISDYSNEKIEIQRLSRELEQDPDNESIMLQLATLYLDNKNFAKAKGLLIRLSQSPEVADIRVYSSLAQLFFQEGEYDSSLVQYQQFLSHLKPNSPTYIRTQERIEQVNFHIDAFSNSFSINPEPLPPPINSPASEYLPQFSIDEENLVFTRRWYGQEDLFQGIRKDTSYSVEGMEVLNTPLNEGAHTISADGNLIIFTHCNEKYGFGSCDLYRAYKTQSGWSRPANLGSTINSMAWESQPSLSANGDRLYFASNRDGGHGGSDIWVSQRNNDGTWGPPKNLGSEINSKGREESPFIHADGKSLYFRSSGHRGLGSFDIFLSRKIDDQWNKPMHLGVPINSVENDGALVISLDGLSGYFASDYYKGNKKDDLDIYRFELPEVFRPIPMTYVKGRVVSDKTKYPLQGKVKIRDIKSDEEIIETQANFNGEFLVAVPIRENLAFSVSVKDHTFHSVSLAFTDIKHGADPYYEEIKLQEVAGNIDTEDDFTPIVLSNVFFETGSSILLEESEGDIQLLYDFLKDHPQLIIQINGHTDSVGEEEANLTLSLDRAESVKQALVEKGIRESRIQSEGYGETKPVADNSTPDGRAKNRRTEFVIIQ